MQVPLETRMQVPLAEQHSHQGQHPRYEGMWALLAVACQGPCSLSL